MRACDVRHGQPLALPLFLRARARLLRRHHLCVLADHANTSFLAALVATRVSAGPAPLQTLSWQVGFAFHLSLRSLRRDFLPVSLPAMADRQRHRRKIIPFSLDIHMLVHRDVQPTRGEQLAGTRPERAPPAQPSPAHPQDPGATATAAGTGWGLEDWNWYDRVTDYHSSASRSAPRHSSLRLGMKMNRVLVGSGSQAHRPRCCRLPGRCSNVATREVGPLGSISYFLYSSSSSVPLTFALPSVSERPGWWRFRSNQLAPLHARGLDRSTSTAQHSRPNVF